MKGRAGLCERAAAAHKAVGIEKEAVPVVGNIREAASQVGGLTGLRKPKKGGDGEVSALSTRRLACGLRPRGDGYVTPALSI